MSLVLAFYLCLKLSDFLLFISAYHDNLYSVPCLVYRISKWVRKSYVWTNLVHIRDKVYHHHHHHHQFDWKRTLDRLVQTFGLQWFQRLDTFTWRHPSLFFDFFCSKGGLKPIWKSERRRRGGKASTHNPLIYLRGIPDHKYIEQFIPHCNQRNVLYKKLHFITELIISFNLCFHLIVLTLPSTEIIKKFFNCVALYFYTY